MVRFISQLNFQNSIIIINDVIARKSRIFSTVELIFNLCFTFVW